MRWQTAQRIAIAGVLGGGAAVLGGCSNGGGGGGVVTPPPSPPAMGAERFGTGFSLSFRAGPDTDPRDPMQADIIPASLTTDPFEVP